MNDELIENLPPKHIAINEKYAWDIFKFPKIINLETGEVINQDESLPSGFQNSSIIHHVDKLPKVVFNQQTKQIVITGANIEIIGR